MNSPIESSRCYATTRSGNILAYLQKIHHATLNAIYLSLSRKGACLPLIALPLEPAEHLSVT